VRFNPPVPAISQQEAIDHDFFGPVYHGTTEEALSSIGEEGFKVFVGGAHEGPVRHGFDSRDWWGGISAPVHFLGYGVYFTTLKSLGKSYGVVKSMYYLDVPNLETINFGAAGTMMKWWLGHGYPPEVAKVDRVAATQLMTEHLAAEFDAVWFKGKGLRRLLDGDQVCVYDPSRIYRVEQSLAPPFGVGSKVKRKSDGMIGVVLKSEPLLDIVEQYPGAQWARDAMIAGAERRLWVRWRKGGTEYNLVDSDVTPFAGRRGRQ
jgi:hypothetical protein